MRTQLSRSMTPLLATGLVFLAACSIEPSTSGRAPESVGALVSARVASDEAPISETDPGSVDVTSSVATTAPGGAASTRDAAANGRPVLQRRADPSASAVKDEDAQHATDEDGGSGSDSDPDGEVEDDSDLDVEEDEGPQISRRETMLAWLAEDSLSASFPAPTARTGAGGSVPRIVLPEEPFEFDRPDAVKAIYVNSWAAGSSGRSQALIDLATRTEVNAFVIDLKDATGYVSHPTEVMTAREAGADQEIRIRDLMGLLERIQEADIYPIARIVIVKDPLLIRAKPEWSVQDTAGGPWVDSKGLVWANLYDQRVWDYHVELAKEAAAIGFPEIQWDYVRFADAPREDLDRAVYPGADGRLRREAVGAFLEYARAELEEFDVDMTIDVFGATTSARSDVGIGQYWEHFIGAVDSALPMVYPSHYWTGSFGIQDPNGHPYEIVREALVAGLERSKTVEGAGTIRPWLQDFTLGAPLYEAAEVRAQIQATYDAGIDEWLLWNPSSRYTEGALEPADGLPEGMEPMMRVGGKVVPVSERYEAMAAEAEERRVAAILADSIAAVQAAAMADSLVVELDASDAESGDSGAADGGLDVAGGSASGASGGVRR